MSADVKKLASEALGPDRLKSLWTANNFAAFPLTPQAYDLGAVLPAMLYMARWGWRRGKGQFARAFAGPSGDVCLQDVSRVLVNQPEASFEGFDDAVGQAMLSDLLLTWCLENKGHKEGHKEAVLRVFPTHYLASWIDLPAAVANLRGVPEWLTCLLAEQPDGAWLEVGQRHSAFPVGVGFADNALLALVGRHMQIQGKHLSDLSSDRLEEAQAHDLGIDELLGIRMAQACRTAPLKARGKDEAEQIPNRHAMAKAAAQALREDLKVLIAKLGPALPRSVFLDMLQAGVGLGLTQVTLSTAAMLSRWETSGRVPEPSEQTPWPLFVDASRGQDKVLRELSETAMIETVRRYERLPVLTMLLRVLEDRVRVDRKLREQVPQSSPDATALFNLLGEVLHERHARSEALLDALDEDCQRLARAVREEAPEVAERLEHQPGHPAVRMAEAMCDLIGDKHRQNFMSALESALMTNEPPGLAVSRRVSRTQNGVRQSLDLRSIVLSSSLLDFLVHRHLHGVRGLSLQDFLRLLRERYGLYIDQAPPGLSVPQSALWDNRRWLEKHLRDLGLLMGVNDAESMKQLKPRYALGERDAV